MKKEELSFNELSAICEDSGGDCFFCKLSATCERSDFKPDEKERPESKLFPFMEERIYGRELVFK